MYLSKIEESEQSDLSTALLSFLLSFKYFKEQKRERAQKSNLAYWRRTRLCPRKCLYTPTLCQPMCWGKEGQCLHTGLIKHCCKAWCGWPEPAKRPSSWPLREKRGESIKKNNWENTLRRKKNLKPISSKTTGWLYGLHAWPMGQVLRLETELNGLHLTAHPNLSWQHAVLQTCLTGYLFHKASTPQPTLKTHTQTERPQCGLLSRPEPPSRQLFCLSLTGTGAHLLSPILDCNFREHQNQASQSSASSIPNTAPKSREVCSIFWIMVKLNWC